ncbi:hypothetical protein [Sediminibacterium sp.]|uniref:hypothetical protein n=1 Tax=Sediminibacterium sp. TaxID=1917865 RepID=UPI002736710D|nr:hypothetical protein [Sediminibacterium sp.]MDP3392692.1 hypothetical protein [Sediminibacterium sp.]MDP3566065.1 hypothetical protein [Sediminibacterium sp.]
MKKGRMLLLSLVFVQLIYAQSEKLHYQHFNKGKSFWGIGLSPVYSDMMGSYTDISITKGNTNLGILLAPMYGKFVQQNWMIGVMGIAGVHTERRSYLTYPITIGPGPSFPSVDTKNIDNSIDIGIAPITRYYLPFNKRNSAAFFVQAALPAVYSKSNYILRYKYASGAVDEFKTMNDQFSLRGSIGFGVSMQGKFGSFDTHVSNMGWFLSFNKLIQKK